MAKIFSRGETARCVSGAMQCAVSSQEPQMERTHRMLPPSLDKLTVSHFAHSLIAHAVPGLARMAVIVRVQEILVVERDEFHQAFPIEILVVGIERLRGIEDAHVDGQRLIGLGVERFEREAIDEIVCEGIVLVERWQVVDEKHRLQHARGARVSVRNVIALRIGADDHADRSMRVNGVAISLRVVFGHEDRRFFPEWAVADEFHEAPQSEIVVAHV